MFRVFKEQTRPHKEKKTKNEMDSSVETIDKEEKSDK